MDTDIRRAELPDVPQLLALYSLLDIGSETALSLEQAQSRFVELVADPRHQIYVAEQERKIVGTFALIFLGGIPHRARDSCIIEDVVVDPTLQRSGIGRQMMQFAMACCERADCYKLVLSSHLNRRAAHDFYEGLGFSKHGFSFLIEGPAPR